jgi:hypothetical protein
MKFPIYFIAVVALMMVFILPQNSYSKNKSQSWAGTYVLKGGGGGLVIEKEGKKLWIEMWKDFEADEEKWPPGAEKNEDVYFASIHGDTAKRLPFRGDICPQTFILAVDGVKLIDECNFSPRIYYFERVK